VEADNIGFQKKGFTHFRLLTAEVESFINKASLEITIRGRSGILQTLERKSPFNFYLPYTYLKEGGIRSAPYLQDQSSILLQVKVKSKDELISYVCILNDPTKWEWQDFMDWVQQVYRAASLSENHPDFGNIENSIQKEKDASSIHLFFASEKNPLWVALSPEGKKALEASKAQEFKFIRALQASKPANVVPQYATRVVGVENLIQEGRITDALQLCQDILSSEFLSVSVHYPNTYYQLKLYQAWLHEQAYSFEAAISIYDSIILSASNRFQHGATASAELGLASTYQTMGQYKKAIEHFRLANTWIEKCSDTNIEYNLKKQFHFQLKNLYTEIGNTEKQIFHSKQLAILEERNSNIIECFPFSIESVSHNLKPSWVQLREQAKQKIAENDLDAALSCFQQASQEVLRVKNQIVDMEYKLSFQEANRDIDRYIQYLLVTKGRTNEALIYADSTRAALLYEHVQRYLENKIEDQGLSRVQRIVRDSNSTVLYYSWLPEVNKIYTWVLTPEGEVDFFEQSCTDSLVTLWEHSRKIIESQYSLPDYLNKYGLAEYISKFEAVGIDNTEVLKNEMHRWDEKSLAEKDSLSKRFTFNSEEEETSFRNKLDNLFLRENKPKKYLYNIFLKSVETKLLGAKQIIIVPDGEISRISFASLQDEHNEYCIEKYAITYGNSLQMIGYTHERSRQIKGFSSSRNFTIVGNPSFVKQRNGQRISDLPGAQAEAVEIEKLIKAMGGEVCLLFGTDASIPHILEKVAGSQLLHLATHGVCDTKSSTPWRMNSSFAMAAQDSHNGIWKTSDISTSYFPLQCVVMSSCNAIGGSVVEENHRIFPSEGDIAFKRAFFMAGVPSLISTCDSVDDHATKRLQPFFYEYLLNGEVLAVALQKAMLDMRNARLISDSIEERGISRRFSAAEYWDKFMIYGHGAAKLVEGNGE